MEAVLRGCRDFRRAIHPPAQGRLARGKEDRWFLSDIIAFERQGEDCQLLLTGKLSDIWEISVKRTCSWI